MFARDGMEALQSLERNPDVGLVLLDINMPRMDGLTLLQKLQEAEADDKRSTIIVSAYGDMNNIRVAMNRGAFDFLTKPIDFSDLEKTIDKTLRHVEMMREYRRRQIQAERAHASLCRYFSPQLASRLAADEGTGMDVHRREVAAMFTDVTGFTSMVECIAPELLGTLLNEYMAGMTEVVFAHEGTVAKVMGDGMHILFNAPGDQPDYATRAIACAHDLDDWAVEFRERWRAKGVNFGVTRIGVHAGPCWSAISAAAGFSTTPRTGIPSTPRRGSNPPTSFWVRAFASAPSSPMLRMTFMGVRSATWSCEGVANRCAPMSRCRRQRSGERRRPTMLLRLQSSRPVTLTPCRLSPQLSGFMPTIPWPAFTCDGCSTVPKASACSWNNWLRAVLHAAAFAPGQRVEVNGALVRGFRAGIADHMRHVCGVA